MRVIICEVSHPNLNRIDISRLFLMIWKNVNRKISKKKLEHYYLTILTSIIRLQEGIICSRQKIVDFKFLNGTTYFYHRGVIIAVKINRMTYNSITFAQPWSSEKVQKIYRWFRHESNWTFETNCNYSRQSRWKEQSNNRNYNDVVI